MVRAQIHEAVGYPRLQSLSALNLASEEWGTDLPYCLEEGKGRRVPIRNRGYLAFFLSLEEYERQPHIVSPQFLTRGLLSS